MTRRDELLTAARRAYEVISDFEVKKRIEAGYTRVDPELIAELADVVVLYRSMDRLLGGFLREQDSAGIIVNFARPRGLVHMTCAHELGHYFLGHDSTADDTVEHGNRARLVEQQANHFAYSLLAPQWLVASTMRQKGWNRADLRNPAVVYQLSLRLGTSYSAMVWSLVRIAFLSDPDAGKVASAEPKTLKRKALGGEAPQQPTKDVWVLDASDRDRILEPGDGDEFVVDLPNHAGAGHLWSIDELRSEGFALKPFVRDGRTSGQAAATRIIVGRGPKTLRYTLTASRAAESPEEEVSLGTKRHLIAMRETTPWEPGATPHDEFSFGAEFELIKDGLSRSERDRRLLGARGVG